MNNPLFITLRQSFLILCIKLFSAEAAYIFLEYIFRSFIYEESINNGALFWVLTTLKVFTFLYILLDWYYNFYTIRENLIEYKSGIFIRRTYSFPVDIIDFIEVKQSILGKIFKFGDIIVKSGYHKRQFILHNITAPRSKISIFETLQHESLIEKIG